MTDLDTQVQQFIQQLADRKARYQNAIANRQPWKTNCVLKIIPVSTTTEGSKINVMTVRDIGVLVEAYAWISNRELATNKAATALGVEAYTHFLGYTYSDWKADIKNRVDQLCLEQEGKLIAKLEAQVEGVMSENQKRATQISQLASIFGE